MLKTAGSKGIRSDAFFEAHLPRAAARIKELRDEGHNIISEKEGKFCRYRLAEASESGCGLEQAGTEFDPSPPVADPSEPIPLFGQGGGQGRPRSAFVDPDNFDAAA